VFKNLIRTCVKIKEAPSLKKPPLLVSLFLTMLLNSTAGKEYARLITEVIRRVKR